MLHIPEGYHAVMPYIIVRNAAAFIDFMKEVFDATEKYKALREDSNVVMHAEVKIGDSVIMLAEATDEWSEKTTGLFVYVADADQTFTKAKEAGGTVIMEMTNQPYGRTGGIKDPFGNDWWITTPPAEVG